jgi:hypothetical protein
VKKRSIVNIEIVKEYVESQGYKLLSTEYKRMHDKIDLLCTKKHPYKTTFSNFKNNGARCPLCKRCKKKTLEEVKKIFFEQGYDLISNSYKNNNTKLQSKCPKGHLYIVSLNAFHQAKSRCPICQDRNLYNSETVKKLLAKEGYVLVTPEYKNMHQQLETICSEGHNYTTTLTNFLGNGCRCFTCTGIKRYTIEDIREILKKEGYVLISEIYKNAKQKLEVVCPLGHKIFIRMNGFLSMESRCQHCAPNRPHSLESIKEFVEKEGYVLVSTVYDPQGKIDLICPNGHSYSTTFYNFKGHKRRCSNCTLKGSSVSEIEVASWIKEYFPEAKKYKNYYDSNNGKKYLELDIYIEELNLAIEYDGLIWHSEKYKSDKNFHLNKTKLANNFGIRVIHIFEDEWLERKYQVKGYLKSVLGKNEIKLFARKTDLKEVPKKEARNFLEKYHIQGATVFDIAFGLYSGTDLVAVVTGGTHHRQGHGNIFVLNRLAFKANVSVAGGSSKLLKTLVSYAKEQGYSKLISWSDNRWSEGKVYKSTGFLLEEEMRPDYSYVNRETRISKQSCQKKKLIDKGGVGNTEKEMALSLGLYRIFDCGKKRWVLNLK